MLSAVKTMPYRCLLMALAATASSILAETAHAQAGPLKEAVSIGSAIPAGPTLLLSILSLLFAAGWAYCSRRTGRALLESQTRCRYLSEHSADIIGTTDLSLRHTFVSDSVRRVLGFGPAEYRALPLERRFPEGFVEHLRGSSEPSVPLRFTGRLQTIEGVEIWLEILTTPLRDAKDNLSGYVHVMRDITWYKHSEAQLREQEIRFRKLINDQSDTLLVIGPDGLVRFANPASERLFLNPPEEILGMRFGVPPMDGKPQELCILGGHGRTTAEMWVNEISWDGEHCAIVSLRDVSRRIGAEMALRESEERYRMVAEYTYDWELWIGPDGSVEYTSPSCERISGYPPDDFLRNPSLLDSLVLEDDREAWRTYLHEGMMEDAHPLDFRLIKRGGEIRWVCISCRRVHDEHGSFQGTRSSLRDITDRKNMEIELRHKSLHDSLTGLANRTLCLDRIQRGLQRAKRRASYFFAVVFIDLDRFKIVNESLGHTYGDQVLMVVAERLKLHVRGVDTVSRFGSDEFVLFLDDIDSQREAIAMVKRISEAISRPIHFGRHEVRLTASIGIVLGPVTDILAEHVLRNANIALHRAKELGGDRFKVFTDRMLDQALHKMSLERDMRLGMENDEFFLVYQPVVSMKDRTLVGFEALARWQHPERGLLSPYEFIVLAEETGLIDDLGRHMLRLACKTMAEWRGEFPWTERFFVSVNLSGKQFSNHELIEQIRSTIQESGIRATQLKLEITETAIMEDAENAVEKLRRLKNLGITISIDDFGTGYSSMSYLQQFPLDNLKIDLSFVRLMEISPENKEIVRAIVSLAHTLGLEVVAEGVENEIQEQTLRSLGCEFAQGFLYDPPLTVKDARALMLRSTESAVIIEDDLADTA
ncbi:MAG: EAL and GGDEF domain-containing protein [Oceanidesulfovibrio sp.]